MHLRDPHRGALRLVASEHRDADQAVVLRDLERRHPLPSDVPYFHPAVVRNATRLYALARAERQRAEEASRAKDVFLATVSHELRTPLTAITRRARAHRLSHPMRSTRGGVSRRHVLLARRRGRTS